MKILRIVVFAAIATLLPMASSSSSWAACAGRDLLARIKSTHPDYVATVERDAAALPFNRGKLFRLSKDGVAPSHVFGTAHVSDPRATAFTPIMLSALDQARIVVLELKESEGLGGKQMFEGVDPATMMRFTLATAEQRPDRFLSPELLARLEKALPPYGLPAAAARSFRPSMLALTLAVPACASKEMAAGKVVDALIAQHGRQAGKQIVGLETIVEQLGAVSGFPPAIERELLASMVKILDDAEDAFEALVVRYAAGDIGVVLAWARQLYPVPGIDARMPPEFYAELIDRRNLRMAERTLPLIKDGGVFVAVGAAHLPGETGLLKLFEKAGYRVEKLE
jgi:uncharacterized protein YbaP (TraB family)